MTVLIVLHSGAFVTGRGKVFRPDFLFNHKNIVMVKLKYFINKKKIIFEVKIAGYIQLQNLHKYSRLFEKHGLWRHIQT